MQLLCIKTMELIRISSHLEYWCLPNLMTCNLIGGNNGKRCSADHKFARENYELLARIGHSKVLGPQASSRNKKSKLLRVERFEKAPVTVSSIIQL